MRFVLKDNWPFTDPVTRPPRAAKTQEKKFALKDPAPVAAVESAYLHQLPTRRTAEGGKASGDSEREWSLSQRFAGIGHDDAPLTSDPSRKIGDCRAPPLAWFNPLSKAQSGLIFLVAVPASALLFIFARHVDPGRRRYFHAAAGVGAIGSFTAFILFYFVCNQYETVVISYIGMVVAPLMLVLLGLSGFKAK